MLKANIHKTTVKKAIRKQNFPDPFFLNIYSTSPYSSCQHACVYCDGRAEKYHIQGDFEHDITARINLPDILDKELRNLREISPLSIGSGITDTYQPIEEDLELTRECAKILSGYHFPVSILTKSSLIQRDIDLWHKVNKNSQFMLQMTITSLDDNIRKIFEPNASTIDQRLETIKIFKKAGCPIGIFMMPLLPGITDLPNNITPLLEKLKELKVDFIMPGFLTLRPGRQKDFYMNIIQKHYPNLIEHYNNLFHKPLVSGSPSYQYRNRYKSKFTHLFNDISIEAPHYIYKDKMPKYQEIHLLLSHMKSIYRRRKIDITPLSEAFNNYCIWTEDIKKQFNRKRSLHPDYIDEQLRFLISCNQFTEVIKNNKLAQFIEDVINKEKLFNYHSLKLD